MIEFKRYVKVVKAKLLEKEHPETEEDCTAIFSSGYRLLFDKDSDFYFLLKGNQTVE